MKDLGVAFFNDPSLGFGILMITFQKGALVLLNIYSQIWIQELFEQKYPEQNPDDYLNLYLN